MNTTHRAARGVVTGSLLVVLVAALSACSTPAPTPAQPPAAVLRVVLLPQIDANGHARSTAIEVKSSTGARVLSTPLAVAEWDARGQLNERTASAAEIQTRYATVLNMQPPPPETRVLQFLPGSANLTPESVAELPTLLAKARARMGGELVVVGHTDRQGTAEANDALSLQRAQRVAQMLVEQGFPSELITAVGRGEREPLVPTADGVEEPRNRRAEVIIR
jgi:OmpA-OmpF porin, OOP family